MWLRQQSGEALDVVIRRGTMTDFLLGGVLAANHITELIAQTRNFSLVIAPVS
jgi:hypothetical protein